MKAQIEILQELLRRLEETWKLLKIESMKTAEQDLAAQMQQSDFWSDPEKARKVSKEHDDIAKEIEQWETLKKQIEDLLAFAPELEGHEEDDLAHEFIKNTEELHKTYEKMEFFVLMNGKHDKKNAIVSIHAGSGGTEAQDWASMLLRMVFRFAEKKDWNVSMLDESVGQEAGIKSAVFRVEGRYAYGYLQSEHGTHRLVRISPFDAEQMRHTSFASIEVIPEMDANDAVQIDPKDLRIDTFMSGGKGGQSVNTTYSAVRIVHIPTGITVQCQNERSQLQNKETALKILQSKLQTLQEEKEEKERLELRGEYKSAEWGNQIRSYVLHPYKMVKDVRTRFETTDPEDVLNGNLDGFIEAYLRWKRG